MANAVGFADAVLGAVLEALDPIVAAAQDEGALFALFRDLGWAAPEADVLPSSLDALSAVASAVSAAQQALDSYQNSGSSDPAALEELLRSVVDLLGLLDAFQHQNTSGLPGPLDSQTFWERMAEELPGFLVARYLRRQQPLLYALFRLVGVLDLEPSPANADRVDELVVDTLRWDRISLLLSNPAELFVEVYEWGAYLKYESLLARLRDGLAAAGVTCFLVEPSQEMLDRHYGAGAQTSAQLNALRVPLFINHGDPYVEIGLELFPVPASTGDAPKGFLLTPYATAGLAATAAINDVLSLSFTGTTDGTGATGAIVLPGSVAAFVGGPALDGNLGLSLNYTPSAPQRVLGGTSTTGLSIGSAGLGAELLIFGVQDAEALLRLKVGQTTLSIDFGEGDSFVAAVSDDMKVEARFDAAIVWSSKRGLLFEGGAGLQVTIPLNLSLGPLELITVTLAMVAREGPSAIEAGIDAGLSLGPFDVIIKSIGLRLVLDHGSDGEFFGLRPRFGLRPPTGLGLLVDAGAVTGGGFISFDQDKGRYAGIVQLRIGELAVKAIGILDTKLPGGQPGYSFLLIISGEFPPIQLGFGFTLNGLGGLAGIQRTMVVEALQAGVRSRSLDHVLFPEDPVRDAAQIISDLGTIFPPAEARYVFGPMALIAYGTPSLIEAELGLLLELPDPVRLVILGQIDAALPSKEEAVVELHLDVLGVIDFSKKTLAIDATLHDSRLAAFDLYGDMALLLDWGDQPNFALAIGGFHPAFQPPPAFPELRRVTLALGDGENPRLTLETYLALTSNSLQFGARAELYAEAAGFNISGWLGLDVLVIVSPFSLIADLAAGMALRRRRTLIAGVALRATLTGPTPWHLWGEATLDAIIEITVAFDVTIGEEREERLPDADPTQILLDALANTRNWSATLPPAGFRVVSLAPSVAAGAEPLLDPLGSATVRQRIVPLNRNITKFGEARAIGPGRYTLPQGTVTVQDHFAPGQFEQLSDDEKLSRPSFEKMDAGYTFASDAVEVGEAIGTDVGFNTVILDRPKEPMRPLHLVSEAFQFAALNRSASGRALLTATGAEKFAPPLTAMPLVSLKDEEYCVVSLDTLADESGLDPRATKGAAHEALAEHVRTRPARKGHLQVVPAHELVAT